MSNDKTLQAELNAEYDAALVRALVHIARGTEMSDEERAIEKERARKAALPGYANWAHRTPSPLYPEQVKENIALLGNLKMLQGVFDVAFGKKPKAPPEPLEFALELVRREMFRLVQVWEGTDDVPAVEVLEDAWNTLGTACGLEPKQLRAGWADIMAKEEA